MNPPAAPPSGIRLTEPPFTSLFEPGDGLVLVFSPNVALAHERLATVVRIYRPEELQQMSYESGASGIGGRELAQELGSRVWREARDMLAAAAYRAVLQFVPGVGR